MTWRSFVLGLTLVIPAVSVGWAQDSEASAQPEATEPRSDAAGTNTDAAPASDEPELVEVDAFLRGDGRGVTADEVAEQAVRSAPTIDAVRASLEQARAGVDQAFQAFFPRLELQGSYTRLSEVNQSAIFADPAFGMALPDELANYKFPVLLDNWNFTASLTIPVTDIFLQILPTYEATEGSVRAQRHQMRVQASEVALRAREAFYAYARARGALAVARAAAEAAELQERLISAMVRAGTTAHVDLVRVQAQVAGARVAVIRAEAGTRLTEVALRTLMHAPDEEALGVAENLLEPLPEVNGSREELVQLALERRAEMLAIRELLHIQGRQIEAAEGSRWPRFAIVGNFQILNPHPRIFPVRDSFEPNWTITAALSWAPNDLFRGESQATQIRGQSAQAEADIRSLEDAIRIEVTQAFENLRAARAAIEAAGAGVAAADETLRVRNEQYRAGATVVTELVLAVNDRARAQLDLINAALDARVANSQLARAIANDGPYEGID